LPAVAVARQIGADRAAWVIIAARLLARAVGGHVIHEERSTEIVRGRSQTYRCENEIYRRSKFMPRQQRRILRQGGRTMIPRQLDDAALSQPLDIIVGMAIGTERAKGGGVPESLIGPCDYRRDRDAGRVK